MNNLVFNISQYGAQIAKNNVNYMFANSMEKHHISYFCAIILDFFLQFWVFYFLYV
jgi:hypothetical protein